MHFGPIGQIAALGIDGTKQVVVYVDPLKGWGEDGHALWVLHSYGLRNVRVLNGGISSWLAAGGKVTKDKPAIKPGRTPRATDGSGAEPSNSTP